MDIDELLDFSKGYELYCPPTTTTTTTDSDLHHYHHNHHHHQPPSETISPASIFHPTDFTNTLCVPNDDVAELEWLSTFVDDSFSDYPQNNITGTINFRSETSFHSRSRSKRSRLPSTNWTSSPENITPATMSKSKSTPKSDNNIKIKREVYSPSSSDTSETALRRCSHCASEKTPQWRTGPQGPKTLCNACGVRYKSGRLVPEYRPAASPTFVLTQHSNSHRKVMELRRQKEMHGGGGGGGGQQQQHEVHQLYGHHHRRNYEVC